MEPLLSLSGVSVTYPRRLVLNSVDLTIHPGEIIGITGTSGAGKSTLALCILRALPRQAAVSGNIAYRGRHLGPVFQEPSGALHPMLTAGDQLMETARARIGARGKEARDLALAALAEAGLEGVRVFGAWPHQLSGGERQRVLVAQAIMGRPELLIADEPTASLDRETRAGVMNTFRALKTSILFITHQPNLLKGFANRILVLRDGRLHD